MQPKRKMGLTCAVLCLSAIACAGTERSEDAVTLAQNGTAKAVIVVAGTDTAEHHAAAELAGILEQITGAKFEIKQPPVKGKFRILVGPEAARLAQAGFSTAGLGAEGIVIRSVGNDLILAGGTPRGTLYAVYTFLEETLGCRWWSSKVSTIPHKHTVVVANLETRYVPALEYREPYWYDAFDTNWAVRNKVNGQRPALEAKHGGKHIYEGFVHTFNRLIPPETYFKDHPEWFSEIKGKRTAERAQLCLTNEPMYHELLKNLKTQLRNNPEATIASVSQNDWHGNCQCSQCAAIDKEEGSPAGLMLRFVNRVAEDIEDDFPHVAISTLAYQYTRKPPKITQPRDNVIVRLCSIECSFSKPLSDERNQAFRDDIVGWAKRCDRLYIWDYTTNFRHHIMPHPNLRVLAPNIKFFVEHSVKGIFEQGAYTTNGAEMAELRAWVLAQLLWDPSRDGPALINEFLDGYYGPAGPHIREYLQTTHDAVEASGDWLGCFSKDTTKFLSFEVLDKSWTDLKAAESAVMDNPELRFRVQVAQLPVLYTFMIHWKTMRETAKRSGSAWPMPDSIEAAHEHFMKVARRNKITRLDEWNEGFGALEKAVKRAQE